MDSRGEPLDQPAGDGRREQRVPGTNQPDGGDQVLLGTAGLVIAAAGAILPAGWAARSRTASALRTE